MCSLLRRQAKRNCNVGYSPLPGAQILPVVLRAFQQAMPDVHVRLHDWSNEQIAVGLRDGRLKWRLVARALKRGPFGDFRFEELLREHIRLAVPPKHPFAQRRSVSLADAAQQSFVGLTREDYPDYHGYLATLFASVKNKPQVIEEHDGMTSVVSAVEAAPVWPLHWTYLVTLSASSEASATHSPSQNQSPSASPCEKVDLVPRPRKFWQCAKEAAASIGVFPKK